MVDHLRLVLRVGLVVRVLGCTCDASLRRVGEELGGDVGDGEVDLVLGERGVLVLRPITVPRRDKTRPEAKQGMRCENFP